MKLTIWTYCSEASRQNLSYKCGGYFHKHIVRTIRTYWGNKEQLAVFVEGLDLKIGRGKMCLEHEWQHSGRKNKDVGTHPQ